MPADSLWNAVFLAGFIVYLAIRGVFEKRAKAATHTLSRFDGLEKALMVPVFAGSMLLPVLYLATNWLSFADYRLPVWAPWCGVVVMAAALWLFWRSHADLGLNWSVTLQIREGHQLVRHGVYRRIRHPMYLAIFLFGIAQALLLPNWLAGWSAFAGFLPMYILRVPREEAMMTETFGDQYRQYRRQTGRLLPKWNAAR
jgi:protein-S-isoprenylcysteine O-methyltransferase Ste14